MTSEYGALVLKVAAFTEAAEARQAAALKCSAGCSSCCHAWLRVSAVEAAELRLALARLTPGERASVRARGERELAREAEAEANPKAELAARCALLDDDEKCSVYQARPLVCRTQGHALRYPPGFVPAAAVTRKMENGDVTWCPLNYHDADPSPRDVLDAERVDQILAVVADRYAAAHGLARHERLALSALAAERDVLHEQTARDHELERAPTSPSERAWEYRERDDRSERQDPTCRGTARRR